MTTHQQVRQRSYRLIKNHAKVRGYRLSPETNGKPIDQSGLDVRQGYSPGHSVRAAAIKAGLI